MIGYEKLPSMEKRKIVSSLLLINLNIYKIAVKLKF